MSVADVVALPFPAKDAHLDDDVDGVDLDPAPADEPAADDRGDHAADGGARDTGTARSAHGSEDDPALEPAGAGRAAERKPSSRKQRAKMPSWDEIMFGSRTDA
ncbi:hypothetical protein GCM10025864_35290 [Luteimicrobium album]|uniref:DUF3071 domain-containing protein n=1 Tax=Luteimicrobium album TaxID=1054550 RepID=A0ABQ6I7Q5_9MICO|nr:hypothetical protein [Luteimicrobium album]GMA25770.1 hypothetical protein GCM10025864_35290 [Luteimicrobium album]